ncbi:LysR family transcriptional regulator [Bradyrhizobium jicamae]|uniref:LysR family transcriptional regulator n=1 Tax=Bradyrhizobium jicamae TaxID=280332 RepID=UPI001BAB49E2|nr:LysR family transcriptional regulator [Bradyrhizobium jicamae]MBR0935279.1 LysR family transcriptional regulator [Bradyrhizobium jicamae]
MNTRFLETLIWLSRVGTFREAARQMHATQAAVSQRIATLEEDLGAPLIDRSVRGLKLTPVGERVLQQAERLLGVERELRLTAQPDAAPAGRVRVGVIESVVHTWLTAQVEMLSRRFPAIEQDFTVDTARNLRDQFRRHRLDLLIQNDPVEEAAGNEKLDIVELCRYPIEWIGRPGLLPRRTLRMADLMRVPLLTFSRTSSPHAHVRALFIGSEREPRISSFPSVAAILSLAREGFGLAAIPPIFVRNELERGSLVQYAGPALPQLKVSAVHLDPAAPAVQAVATTTCEVVAAFCRKAGTPWAFSSLQDVPRGRKAGVSATKRRQARSRPRARG